MLEAPIQPEPRLAVGGAVDGRKSPQAISKSKTLAFCVALGVLIPVAGGLLAARFLRDPARPEGMIQANGRIEGDPVTVASKFAGRIARLAVREGATVRRGDLIAVLEDAQAAARVDQMSARVAEAGNAVAQAKARVSQSEALAAATDARITATKTALEVLQREVAIHIRETAAGLEQAQAVLVRAESAERQARRDAERYKRLSDQGDVEVRRSEQAQLALVIAISDLTAARSHLAQAEQQVRNAELGPRRIRAKQEELQALEAQRSMDWAGIEQSHAAWSQAQAAVRQAEAGHREAVSSRADLTITAPIDGVVMTRTCEEGEVVAPGSPLMTLVDLDRLYLRVFVPEAQIGMLQIGLPARIHTDAFPDKPFAAVLKNISSRAEFTPREVQTPDERTKLVFAVKLYLVAGPDHRRVPGMPADAMIRWREGVPWTKPRW